MKQDCEASECVVAAPKNEKATWEHKDTMHANYIPSCSRKKVCF